MRQLYKIDDSRIYLMGTLDGRHRDVEDRAEKYPDIWAAIAPISGTGAAATLEKVRSVPEIIVHGDARPNSAGERLADDGGEAEGAGRGAQIHRSARRFAQ